MLRVAGYELDPELAYAPETNLWVAERPGGELRIGFDPLGAETTGDIVAVSFAAVGARLSFDDPLGIVEAAKFVGPLATPVSGVVSAVNESVVRSPGAINADPFGSWLVELVECDPHDLRTLVRGASAIVSWFTAAVERFRAEGAIAQ